jgi:hypothetical protein
MVSASGGISVVGCPLSVMDRAESQRGVAATQIATIHFPVILSWFTAVAPWLKE